MDHRARFYHLSGKGQPGRLPHWEAYSNPDAETFITGIDYYEHPRQCRLKMLELHPELELSIPRTDDPKPRPRLEAAGLSADHERHTVRWGDGETSTFEHGEKFFKTEDDVFAFNPLEHADMRGWHHIIEAWDFTSEEAIYTMLRRRYAPEPDTAVPESDSMCSFYNTLFMWPMLTFGWEMFLACCLDDRFEAIMDGFAEINRRVFSAMSRLPVNFIVCHDDIMTTRGPVCSPEWMRKYIFPRYEEYWSLLRASGKTVIFMTDGRADAYADDVIACGAGGIFSEPYTDFRAIIRKHPDKFFCGEGDNRVLYRNDPDEIRAMVATMVETSRSAGGYMMGIGNHIPWNIPVEAVKLYLDLCNELAYRT